MSQIYQVNLTHIFPNITRNPGSNFSSASDSTFWVKVTPFFSFSVDTF